VRATMSASERSSRTPSQPIAQLGCEALASGRERYVPRDVATTVEHLQQGQRVRVAASGVPEFATVRFVTPAAQTGSPRYSSPTTPVLSTRSE
jgi:hypothetical protein